MTEAPTVLAGTGRDRFYWHVKYSYAVKSLFRLAEQKVRLCKLLPCVSSKTQAKGK